MTNKTENQGLMVFTHVLQKHGKIEIYAQGTFPEIFGIQAKPFIYWRNTTNTTVFGPFTDIDKALDHYLDYALTAAVANNVIPLKPVPSNVIHVDFVAKKRL